MRLKACGWFPVVSPETAAGELNARRAMYAGVAAFLCVALFQQIGIWTHVAWGDEIQAAILARDSNTLSDWYWNFRYEGHPPLWHVYLKGWLLIGLDPIDALRARVALVSLIAMALIFFASPFPLHLKILIGLSEPILFQFGVVSRSYSLGVMLLFAAAAAWRARGGWMLLPLLPGISTQFVVIGISLVAVRMRDRLPWRACAALVFAASIAVFLYGAPPRDHVLEGQVPFPVFPGNLMLPITESAQLFGSRILWLLLNELLPSA